MPSIKLSLLRMTGWQDQYSVESLPRVMLTDKIGEEISEVSIHVMMPHEVRVKKSMKEVQELEQLREAREKVEGRRKQKNQWKQGNFKSWKEENYHQLLKFKTLERETECGSCLDSVTEMTGMWRCHWDRSLVHQKVSNRPSQDDNGIWGRQKNGEQDSNEALWPSAFQSYWKAKYM